MPDVTVIGGGIVGICSAVALQDSGHSVEIVERTAPGSGATFGNCGLLAAGEVVPISKPGMLKNVPKWLLDPEGPLFVRPDAFIRELPWLLRFLCSGRPGRVREIAHALAALTMRAQDDFEDLLDRAGLSSNLVHFENLVVYDSEADYEKERFAWDLRRSLGFDHEFLHRDDLVGIEPELGGPLGCGVIANRWLHFSDPHLMAVRLAEFFKTRGGIVHKADVTAIRTSGERATALMLESGEAMPVKTVVVAAGAWSKRLVTSLGLRTPLAALRGYHFHVSEPGIHLDHAVLYANGGFVMTPMETGLRLAGTIEVSNLGARPNYRRADLLARRAAAILPRADLGRGERWMGPRPSMPDTLPVIGRAPYHRNVVLAYGHGQLGITLGATTGRIVSDVVLGRTPAIDLF
ncbi:MAG: NAD(P)/FAD-dependent oxidoreductase, partial [Stellaceae bacterium]